MTSFNISDNPVNSSGSYHQPHFTGKESGAQRSLLWSSKVWAFNLRFWYWKNIPKCFHYTSSPHHPMVGTELSLGNNIPWISATYKTGLQEQKVSQALSYTIHHIPNGKAPTLLWGEMTLMKQTSHTFLLGVQGWLNIIFVSVDDIIKEGRRSKLWPLHIKHNFSSNNKHTLLNAGKQKRPPHTIMMLQHKMSSTS